MAWRWFATTFLPVSMRDRTVFSLLDRTSIQGIALERIPDLRIDQLRFTGQSGRAVLNDLSAPQLTRLSTGVVASLSRQELFSQAANGGYIFQQVPASGLTAAQLDFTGPSGKPAGSLLNNLSGDQISQLKATVVAALRANQLFVNCADGSRVLEHISAINLKYEQLRFTDDSGKIHGTLLENLAVQQVAQLDAPVVSRLSADELALIDKSGHTVLVDVNASFLVAVQLTYEYADGQSVLSKLQPAQLSVLNKEVVSGLVRHQLLEELDDNGLTYLNAEGLTNAQLAYLDERGRSVLDKLSDVQLARLNVNTISGLTADQIRQMDRGRLSHLNAKGLTATQLGFVGPDGLTLLSALTPSQIASLDIRTVQGVNNPQLRSLTTAQVAGMRNEQLASLSQSQLGSLNAAGLTYDQLGAGAYNHKSVLSALTREQIGALNPTVVRQFERQELQRVLSTDQISGLKQTQFSALTETQIQYLGGAGIVGSQLVYLDRSGGTVLSDLTTDQIAQLSISVIRGLATDQLRQMTERQQSGLTKAQTGAMSSAQLGGLKVGMFSLTQLGYQTGRSEILLKVLNSLQLSKITALTVSRFTQSQFSILTELQIQALKVYDPVSRTAGLTAPQLAYKTVAGKTVFSSLSFSQIKEILPGELGKLSGVLLAQLSADRVAALTRAQFAALSAAQIKYLNAAGLTSQQLTYLDKDRNRVYSVLSDNQKLQVTDWSNMAVDTLSAEAVSKISSAQFAMLSPQKIQQLNAFGLTSQQLEFTDSVGYAVLQDLLPSQIGKLAPAVFGSLKLVQISNLTPGQVREVSAGQIGKLLLEQIQAFNASDFTMAQLGYVDQEGRSVLNDLSKSQIGQLGALIAKLDDSQLESLSVEQIRGLTAAQIQALSPEHATKFPASAFTADQLSSMLTIGKYLLAAIPGEHLDDIPAGVLAQVKPAVLSQLSASQVANLTQLQFATLASNQVAALDLSQLPSDSLRTYVDSQGNTLLMLKLISEAGSLSPEFGQAMKKYLTDEGFLNHYAGVRQPVNVLNSFSDWKGNTLLYSHEFIAGYEKFKSKVAADPGKYQYLTETYRNVTYKGLIAGDQGGNLLSIQKSAEIMFNNFVAFHGAVKLYPRSPGSETNVSAYSQDVANGLENQLGRIEMVQEQYNNIQKNIDVLVNNGVPDEILRWALDGFSANPLAPATWNYDNRDGNLDNDDNLVFREAFNRALTELFTDADSFVKSANQGIAQVVENKRVADVKTLIGQILDTIGAVVSLGVGLGKVLTASDLTRKILETGALVSSSSSSVKNETNDWLRPDQHGEYAGGFSASAYRDIHDQLSDFSSESDRLSNAMKNFDSDFKALIKTLDDHLWHQKTYITTGPSQDYILGPYGPEAPFVASCFLFIEAEPAKPFALEAPTNGRIMYDIYGYNPA